MLGCAAQALVLAFILRFRFFIMNNLSSGISACCRQWIHLSRLAWGSPQNLRMLSALSGFWLFAGLASLGSCHPRLALYCLALWAMASPPQLWNAFPIQLLQRRLFKTLKPLLKSLGQRYCSSPFLALAAVAGLAMVLVLSSAGLSPAQAQFLQAAEQAATELTTGLGGSTNISPVIKFIFGALRLLLIVYMAVALIQIVNAARQGEEWKDLVRTPLLIILVVIIGDFIAAIVVGGGTAA